MKGIRRGTRCGICGEVIENDDYNWFDPMIGWQHSICPFYQSAAMEPSAVDAAPNPIRTSPRQCAGPA